MENPVEYYGAVSRINLPDHDHSHNLSPILIERTGSKTFPVYMLFGDSSNLIRPNLSYGDDVYDAKVIYNGTDVGKAVSTVLGPAPISVKAIVLNLDHASFFDDWRFENWIYVHGDIDGSINSRQIPIASALRNDNFTNNNTVVEFTKPLIIGGFSGLIIPIPSGYGETVRAWVIPSAAANRF